MRTHPSSSSRTIEYSVHASWWSRPETPNLLAQRWINLIERFRLIHPVLANWFIAPRQSMIPFDPRIEQVTEFIAAGVTKDDFGEPDPYYGYNCWARNTLHRQSPTGFITRVYAGGQSEIGTDSVHLTTESGIAPDPRILTYDIFRDAVLAIGESFDATGVSAYSTALSDLWPDDRIRCPAVNLGWISYVGPQDAHLVTPPLTAIAEHRPDGGLLMAATDETFVTTNPAHLAVARDIEAALAPFNAKMAAEAEARLQERRRAAAEAARAFSNRTESSDR